jgi:hypothetical protein
MKLEDGQLPSEVETIQDVGEMRPWGAQDTINAVLVLIILSCIVVVIVILLGPPVGNVYSNVMMGSI